MLTIIKNKIRNLVDDTPATSDFESFVYTNSSTFTLAEENINAIISVSKNGTPLGSGEYSYDIDSNELTIIVSLVDKDIIVVKYTFYKYSETELTAYILSSLSWISIFGEKNFEIDSDEFSPTPNAKELNLIAIIASILILPNYSFKSLPNLTIRYPRELSKEKRIKMMITDFYRGIGIIDTLD